MKITQFDPGYSSRLGNGTTFLESSTGSNGGFGPDVTGSWGDLSVVGLRQRVSLQSNMGDNTLGTVLTTIQSSPWIAAFAVSSNAALSFGSNAMSVGATNQAGTSGTYIGADHRHLGLHSITSSSSNTLDRPVVNIRAGAGVGITATDSDGNGVLDTITITSSGSGGGGGSSGIGTGTSFPGSPATNDLFFRTDRGLLYYYDGTRWVTVNEYDQSLAVLDVLEPVSATNPILFGTRVQGNNGIYVTNLDCSTFSSGTNNGTNYWTYQLVRRTSTSTDTNVGSSFNTSADTANAWTRHDVAIGVAVTADEMWVLKVTKVSAPSTAYAAANVRYRLIG